MKRGFTLIELMIASSLTAILFAGILTVFYSIWQLMKGSSDELQLALHARTVREYLLVKLDKDHDGLFGVNAQVSGTPSLSTGFYIYVAKSQRNYSLETLETEPYRIPVDTRLGYLQGTRPADLGLKSCGYRTGDAVDKIYAYEFMESTKLAFAKKAADGQVTALFRLNLGYRPNNSKTDIIYEDHPVFWMYNDITW